MTEPKPPPAVTTSAPALSRAAGSTASGAISSRPHAQILGDGAGVVDVRSVGGGGQLSQRLAHDRLAAGPVLVCFGMGSRAVSRPRCVQIAYQGIDFGNHALGIS